MIIKIDDNKLLKRLDKINIERSLPKIVLSVSGFLENERTKNINKRIYAQPPSPKYKRSGRALGGTKNEALNSTIRRVISDARLKGAKTNYTPFLNRNKRIKRFNTNFWDDAVKATKAKTKEIIKRFIKI